jgi:nicotinate phosphoribosyltransferase
MKDSMINSDKRRVAEGILYTDQYQLTMAQLYYRTEMHTRSARFDYYFRSYPDYGRHQAGYCISAGLEWLIDWMKRARFGDEEIDYLRTHRTRAGARLFQDDFLSWLRENGTFDGITMTAVPEGRVIHPTEPVIMVEGPIVMAQILETALLNQINYQTLIATKAARLFESARGRPILEFGMRRAQDQAALAGARAALIGGAASTSDVALAYMMDVPPQGTHAHSMVQTFMALDMGELGAFRAFAEVYPDDCTLLVDTIDTLESGVPNAITVFKELQSKGHKPVGIRLDSGDLAYLSIRAAKMLNDAGFKDVSIVLSNQLDELVIWQVITQITLEAPAYEVDPDHLINRLVYGVGTRLITSEGDPALDGVYKLVAVQEGENWLPAIKISESAQKTPTPGRKKVWRLYDERHLATADLIGLDDEDPRLMEPIVLHDPFDYTRYRALDSVNCPDNEPLLVEILRDGRLVYDPPPLEEMRRVRESDVAKLDPGVKRLVNPHIYHVSLTQKLWDLKQELITSAMDKSR